MAQKKRKYGFHKWASRRRKKAFYSADPAQEYWGRHGFQVVMQP